MRALEGPVGAPQSRAVAARAVIATSRRRLVICPLQSRPASCQRSRSLAAFEGAGIPEQIPLEDRTRSQRPPLLGLAHRHLSGVLYRSAIYREATVSRKLQKPPS